MLPKRIGQQGAGAVLEGTPVVRHGGSAQGRDFRGAPGGGGISVVDHAGLEPGRVLVLFELVGRQDKLLMVGVGASDGGAFAQPAGSGRQRLGSPVAQFLVFLLQLFELLLMAGQHGAQVTLFAA